MSASYPETIKCFFSSFPDGKFVSLIRFYDAQNIVQPHLFANNLRLEHTVPRMVLRNSSAEFITATPRFLTATGKESEAINLPRMRLAPYEVREVNLEPLMRAAARRSDLSSVSVKVLNSGPPGSLIGALYSQNRNTGIIYEAPLRDSGPPRASTGGYPVRLDGNYTTIVSITNTGERAGEFTMQINHEGGAYAFGLLSLNGGETKTFDIRKLRHEQTPDINGNRLPGDMQTAQIRWSVRGNGSVRLIGRAELVNVNDGVSSSYSCWQCCPNSYNFGAVAPFSASVTLVVRSPTRHMNTNGTVTALGFSRSLSITATGPALMSQWRL